MESEELIRIEAKLLEQEHRPLTLIKNFFGRKKWNENDPRRKAVKVAIVWRILFSPGVIAATGGFIAFLSLIVLVCQTFVLLNQNSLIVDQNKKINQQSYLIEAQRRSSLQFEISEILNRIDDELKKDNERKLSPELKSRIIAATISMKPYRSYENDSLQNPYSYEKGQFFVALINSKIYEQDLSEIFDQGNFSDMILNNIVLGNYNESVILKKIKIENSFFRNVEFRGFEIEEMKFSNCVFDECKFFGSYNDLSFSSSEILNSSMAYDKDHYFGSSITIYNSGFKNCSFTGNEEKIEEIDISILGQKNSIKYCTVNSILLNFDFPGDNAFILADELVLTNGFECNIDISGIEEYFHISKIYVPENLPLSPDLAFTEVGTLEGSDIVEKFNDSLGITSYFITNNETYREYKKFQD